MPPIFLIPILLLSPHLFAFTTPQLDSLVWSFDTSTSQIYYGNDPIDSIVMADSVLQYFRSHPVFWRVKEKTFSLPDTLFVGNAPVSTKLMLDKKFIAQGAMNRWLKDNRGRLLSSMISMKPHFITAVVMLLKNSIRELQGATVALVNKDNSKFMEWQFTDQFFEAKRDIAKLKAAKDTLNQFLKNCPDTINAFYSYKKLFQIAVLLDVAIGHALQYSAALESADRKIPGEIATINSWINDVLLGEMIAIESFCYRSVPAAKPYCYEDLIEYVVNAEKRGMALLSVEDLGKIRVRR
jgi:hypothetical protein